MKTIKDLEVQISPIPNYSISGWHKFIYNYGLFNCKILKFRSANEVLEIMKGLDPTCLTKEDKKFILKSSNTEVLVYLCCSHEERPDIFIFENNNIAFTVDCFF